jgi:hypothetical protein
MKEQYRLELPLEEKTRILATEYRERPGDATEFFIVQCIGYEKTLHLLYALLPELGEKGLDILLRGLLVYLQANRRAIPPQKQKDICYTFLKQLYTKRPSNYSTTLGLIALQYVLLYYQTELKGAEGQNIYRNILYAVKGDLKGYDALADFFMLRDQVVFWCLKMPVIQAWIDEEKYTKLFYFYYEEEKWVAEKKKSVRLEWIIDTDYATYWLMTGERNGDPDCYVADYHNLSNDIQLLIYAAKELGSEAAYFALQEVKEEYRLERAEMKRKQEARQKAQEMREVEARNQWMRLQELREAEISLALTGEMKSVDQWHYEGKMDDVSYYLYDDWKKRQ